jgi:hypothetical protein
MHTICECYYYLCDAYLVIWLYMYTRTKGATLPVYFLEWSEFMDAICE